MFITSVHNQMLILTDPKTAEAHMYQKGACRSTRIYFPPIIQFKGVQKLLQFQDVAGTTTAKRSHIAQSKLRQLPLVNSKTKVHRSRLCIQKSTMFSKRLPFVFYLFEYVSKK